MQRCWRWLHRPFISRPSVVPLTDAARSLECSRLLAFWTEAIGGEPVARSATVKNFVVDPRRTGTGGATSLVTVERGRWKDLFHNINSALLTPVEDDRIG